MQLWRAELVLWFYAARVRLQIQLTKLYQRRDSSGRTAAAGQQRRDSGGGTAAAGQQRRDSGGGTAAWAGQQQRRNSSGGTAAAGQQWGRNSSSGTAAAGQQRGRKSSGGTAAAGQQRWDSSGATAGRRRAAGQEPGDATVRWDRQMMNRGPRGYQRRASIQDILWSSVPTMGSGSRSLYRRKIYPACC